MNLVTNLDNSIVNSDWFDSIEIINNKILVYVKEMSLDILQAIPQKIDGKPVFVHFLSSKNVSIDHYVDKKDFGSTTQSGSEYQMLHCELSDMRKLCDYSSILDIFYEIHDGDNAITSFSEEYPMIKESMKVLYNKYGFDPIFKEINFRIEMEEDLLD